MIALFYKLQILFHAGSFHFTLDFLRQLFVIVWVMPNKKNILIVLAAQTRTFYHMNNSIEHATQLLKNIHSASTHGFAH